MNEETKEKKVVKQIKKSNVEYENFELISVKIIDKKDVDIRYINLENPNRTEHPEGKDLPTEKFKESLMALNEVFAKHSGHLDGWNFARDNIKGNLDATKIARDSYQREVENHNVSGVKFLIGGNKGVQISGYRKIESGGGYGYSSPKIFFDGDNVDNPEELIALVEEVKVRTYNYLFKGEFGVKKKKDEPDPNQTSILDAEQQQQEE